MASVFKIGRLKTDYINRHDLLVFSIDRYPLSEKNSLQYKTARRYKVEFEHRCFVLSIICRFRCDIFIKKHWSKNLVSEKNPHSQMNSFPCYQHVNEPSLHFPWFFWKYGYSPTYFQVKKVDIWSRSNWLYSVPNAPFLPHFHCK